MKKFVALIMVVMMLIGGMATAEVDFSGMTFAELWEAYNQITSELYIKALVEGVQIPMGDYVAGTDFPAGSYILTYTWEEKDILGEKYHGIRVLDPDGNIVKPYWISLEYPSTQAKVTLREGDRLSLNTSVNSHEVKPTIQLLIPYLIGQ